MTKLDNAFATGGTFDAVVTAVVVVVAVPVVLAVIEIVLALVAHQVVEREAVVGGDEIDTVIRPAAARLVKIAGACESRGHGAGHAVIAAPETADVVAVMSIPLGPPLRGEGADLERAGRVPGLGDDLGVGQH